MGKNTQLAKEMRRHPLRLELADLMRDRGLTASDVEPADTRDIRRRLSRDGKRPDMDTLPPPPASMTERECQQAIERITGDTPRCIRSRPVRPHTPGWNTGLPGRP